MQNFVFFVCMKFIDFERQFSRLKVAGIVILGAIEFWMWQWQLQQLSYLILYYMFIPLYLRNMCCLLPVYQHCNWRRYVYVLESIGDLPLNGQIFFCDYLNICRQWWKQKWLKHLNAYFGCLSTLKDYKAKLHKLKRVRALISVSKILMQKPVGKKYQSLVSEKKNFHSFYRFLPIVIKFEALLIMNFILFMQAFTQGVSIWKADK